MVSLIHGNYCDFEVQGYLSGITGTSQKYGRTTSDNKKRFSHCVSNAAAPSPPKKIFLWLNEEEYQDYRKYCRSFAGRGLGGSTKVKILLDTHIWIWNLSGSESLPSKFREMIDSDEHEIWLSPISIWETIVLAEKGRLELLPNPVSWVRQALEKSAAKEAPINSEVAIKSRELDLPHQDPADRFLAATAVIYGLHLATLDRVLLAADWLPTLTPSS